MNLILFDRQELRGNRLLLQDRRAEHVVAVLGVEPGALVRVGEIGGRMGRARVAAIGPGAVELEVVLDSPPPPAPRIDLILALPRPIMLKRILYQAAVLGVGHIHLLRSRRVEKSYFQASLLAPDALREVLLLGLEQAVDTRLPGVTLHDRFRPFVEDTAARMSHGWKLLAHPGGETDLDGLFAARGPGAEERALLAIGPEGGWIDFEVELFRAAGFLPFSIGSRILRVDTAVVALLGRLSLFRS